MYWVIYEGRRCVFTIILFTLAVSITLLYYYAGSGEQHRILETKRNKLVKFRATVSDSILVVC